MQTDTYLIFLLTTAVVVFSPGAAAIAVAAQGAANGFRRALFCALGVACANALYFALSATGVASLIVASNFLFSIIKWVGVAYLIYLGLGAIFSVSGGIRVGKGARQAKLSGLFRRGFVVEISNPKALLYFTAIVPQFLVPTAPILPQILLMGITTLAMDMVSYGCYAYLGERLTSGSIKDWVVRLINRLAGGALIFAGVKMAGVTAGEG